MAWLSNKNWWLPDRDEAEGFQQVRDRLWDFLYVVPLAVVFLAVRFAAEKFVMRPIGRKFGIKENRHSDVLPNYASSSLEKAYDKMLRTNGRTRDNEVDVGMLAKEANVAVREVERWLRRRNQKSKSNKLKKFSESGWLCICYTFTSALGFSVLWDKRWLWEISDSFAFSDTMVPTKGIWWYYMLETALYVSCLVTQFVDNKRKDHNMMVLHHVATITLLAVSWTSKNERIGSLVLLCHDVADIFLSAGKVWLYSKKTTLLHITFVIFLLVWIVTRLVILPFWIMWSGLMDSGGGYGGFISGSIIFSFITVLLIMHVLWTGYILKMLHRLLFTDSQDDPRSDVDSDDTDNKAD